MARGVKRLCFCGPVVMLALFRMKNKPYVVRNVKNRTFFKIGTFFFKLQKVTKSNF